MTDTRNMTLRNLVDYYDPKLPDSALAPVPNGLLRATPQPAPDAVREALAEQLSKLPLHPDYRTPYPYMCFVAGLAMSGEERDLIVAALRSAPVPSPDGAGETLKKQAIAAAEGIDLLQDSRSLRRRTAEILRELVTALHASATGAAEPVSDERALELAHQICTGKLSTVQGAVEIMQYATDGVLQIQATTSPVRGDREEIAEYLFDLFSPSANEEEQYSGISEPRKDVYRAHADAILSLPVQSTVRPDREAAAQVIAKRHYGAKLEDLEGVTMDNCRDTVTEIFELAGVQPGAGEREAIMRIIMDRSTLGGMASGAIADAILSIHRTTVPASTPVRSL